MDAKETEKKKPVMKDVYKNTFKMKVDTSAGKQFMKKMAQELARTIESDFAHGDYLKVIDDCDHLLGFSSTDWSVIKKKEFATKKKGAALEQIGLLHMQQKEYEEAIRCFNDALSCDPTCSVAQTQKEIATQAVSALEIMKTLIEPSNEKPPAVVVLSPKLPPKPKSKLNTSLSHFAAVQKKIPEYELVRNRLEPAWTAFYEAKYEKAIELFSDIPYKDQGGPEGHAQAEKMSRALGVLGREQAFLQWSAECEKVARYVGALRYACMVLDQNPSEEASRKILLRLKNKSPDTRAEAENWSEAFFERGGACLDDYRLDGFVAAADFFDLAIQCNESSTLAIKFFAQTQLLIGQNYCERANYGAAAQYYAVALKFAPESDEIKSAISVLQQKQNMVTPSAPPLEDLELTELEQQEFAACKNAPVKKPLPKPPLPPKKKPQSEASSPAFVGSLNSETSLSFMADPERSNSGYGFGIFDVTQEEVINMLMALASDSAAQEELAEEIYDAFRNNHIEQTSHFKALYRAYEDAGFSGEEREKRNQDLLDYCKRSSVFHAYIESYLGNLWLGYKSALLYARVSDITVYVWGSTGVANNIALIKFEESQKPKKVLHLLAANGYRQFILLREIPTAVLNITLAKKVEMHDGAEFIVPDIQENLRFAEIEENKHKKLWFFDAEIPNEEKDYHLIPAGEEDMRKVVEAYQRCPPAGKELLSVEIIYNAELDRGFFGQVKLLQKRAKNPGFQPKWPAGPFAERRRAIDTMRKNLSDRYHDDEHPDVKLVPVWHGTSSDAVTHIFTTGYANLSSTDAGWFGKGLYSAVEIEYADRVYSDGALILNWVAFYSAYPVIREDMNDLIGGSNYENYDAHFVPVVPQNPKNPKENSYVAMSKTDKEPKYTEIVVFNAFQCLPRYLVRLQSSSFLKSSGLFKAANGQMYSDKMAAENADKKNAAKK